MYGVDYKELSRHFGSLLVDINIAFRRGGGGQIP